MKWDEMTERERDVSAWVSVYECPEPEWCDGEPYFADTPSVVIASYSTDIAAAWQVFDRAQDYCDFGMVGHKGFGETGYTCQFVTMTPDGQYEAHEVCASADTAPKAICKAALLLLGANIE